MGTLIPVDPARLQAEYESAVARRETALAALVTAVLNQKGGVGKTGLTVGVAGALAARGRRVLTLDLDPQGHLTTEALGMEEIAPTEPNLADALTGDFSGALTDLIVNHSTHSSGGRIDVLPTSVAMFLVVKKLYLGRAKEWALARLLEQLPPGLYDHILVDCPPALDILTDNALVASEGVLIPVQPARTSLRALRLLLDQVGVLEQEMRIPPRRLYGLVPSLYRRPLPGIGQYVMGQLEALADPGDTDSDPLPMLAHLPLATVVEEAWLQGLPVPEYAPGSPQARAYERVAIRLDIAAALEEPAAWKALDELPSLAPVKKG